MICLKEKGKKLWKTEMFIRENSFWEKNKVKECWFSKMEVFIKGHSKKINSMGRVLWKIIKWDMLEIGKTIRKMVKELIFLKMGLFTKENIKMTRKMEWENILLQKEFR